MKPLRLIPHGSGRGPVRTGLIADTLDRVDASQGHLQKLKLTYAIFEQLMCCKNGSMCALKAYCTSKEYR